MAYVSTLTIEPDRYAPWIACMWQEQPPEVTLICYLHLPRAPDGARRMLVVWDADDVNRPRMERWFGGFGRLETEAATLTTPGLAAALERDLDAFAAMLGQRGLGPDDVAHEIDLRRRGYEAPTREAAIAAGEAWDRGA